MAMWRYTLAGFVSAALLLPVPVAAAGADDRLLYQASEREGAVALDASRYQNDGRLLGGVTRRQGAYRFHGLSSPGHQYDRIRAPFDPSFNPGSAPFSYGVRLKVSPNAEWSHHDMAVLRHGDTETPLGDYKLELLKTASGVVVAICAMHDGEGDGSGYVRSRGRLTTVADGQWHTVTCGRVDRDTVSLTIDGHVTQRATKGDLDSIVGYDPILIGCQFKRDGIHRREQFVGLMDDIRIRVR